MIYDLSAVTDGLIGLVKSAWQSAPIWAEIGGAGALPTFTPAFTGLAPDAMRLESGPQLSMWLYHVESNNAQEAMFWSSQAQTTGGAPVRFQPFALDLYYLMSSYSEGNYAEEQEAMSVGLRVLHANPIVRSDPAASAQWELTLTMEHRSYDEISRLWQATMTSLRLGVVYRAAVAFIAPDVLTDDEQLVQTVNIDVEQLPLAVAADAGEPS